MSPKDKVLILMGSDSDLPVLREAVDLLREFGVQFQIRVLSAHRSPDEAASAARNAEREGFRVIIAAAGYAAHLAGVVAAHTVLPVIGVPIEGGPLRGLDALYSTVMMPPGVPVGTMAIGGGRNAAIFALEILGVGEEQIRNELRALKARLSRSVLEKDRKVREGLGE